METTKQDSNQIHNNNNTTLFFIDTQIYHNGNMILVKNVNSKLPKQERNFILCKWYNELLKEGKWGKEDMYQIMSVRLLEQYKEKLAPFTIRQIVNGKEKRYVEYRKRKKLLTETRVILKVI
jgi:hypothetical protein